MQDPQSLESGSGLRSGLQTGHESGRRNSEAERHPSGSVALHAGMSSGCEHHDIISQLPSQSAAPGIGTDHGQHSGAEPAWEAEKHHPGAAYVGHDRQGPPDAHVAPSRAALEGDSLATPRGGLQHPAGFGSPLDPISGLLRGSDSEDGTPATAPLDALQHASRSGLPATGAVEGHTSASNVPASGADHSSAGSLPEQQARRSDQSLGEGVALGNGPSAADIDRLHGAPGRGVVENAFAVEPQDGDVGWASRCGSCTCVH